MDLIIDINECESIADICVQDCTNTIGSYECSCQAGCRLDSNDKTCLGNVTSVKK